MIRHRAMPILLALTGVMIVLIVAANLRSSPPSAAILGAGPADGQEEGNADHTHTMPDGTVMDGATHDEHANAHDDHGVDGTHHGSGGHDHPIPDASNFPSGIVPTRIQIPAIGVDATIIKMNITADEVEVPSNFSEVAWWTQTRQPGEIGPAVMGGHVDSRSGPAVFFRLKDLQPGDEIIIHGDDGEVRTFIVERGLQADKYERPPEVFGFGEPRPELRLITCTGAFDPSIGHYTDNYVIFAHEADDA